MLRVATERLYYSDAYLTEFTGEVVKTSDGGRRVYLDRTAFYPASGGQPYDLGRLGGQEVIEVIDEDDEIAHLLAASPSAGSLTGKIHWPRRYEHMQQHTGQHLLSAVLEELFGFATLSFHMGEEVSTIELNAKEIAEEQIEKAEARADELARGAAKVRIGFEDAAAVQGLRKQSARAGVLRIVEIEGIDKSACGGTHVARLAETLPIQIRRLEKVRGHVRLEFVCGGRALRQAKRDFRVAQELARLCAAPLDKLPDQVAALKERLSETGKELLRLKEVLARREGAELYAACEPGPDGVRRAHWDVEQIDETVRAKALAFASGAKSLVLVVSRQPAGVLIACSPDAGIHAGTLLKETLSQFGGRGGGAATLAQGSVPGEDCVRALARRLGIG